MKKSWNEGVSRIGSFQRLWDSICSMHLAQLLRTVGNSWHSLVYYSITLISSFVSHELRLYVPVSDLSPFVIRPPVIGSRVHHLYRMFSRLASAKILFPNKATFQGLVFGLLFWRDIIQATTDLQENIEYKQANMFKYINSYFLF